jgi:hypothetical protein
MINYFLILVGSPEMDEIKEITYIERYDGVAIIVYYKSGKIICTFKPDVVNTTK